MKLKKNDKKYKMFICQEHPCIVAKVYCIDCQMIICELFCIHDKHKNHKMIENEKSKAKYKKQIKLTCQYIEFKDKRKINNLYDNYYKVK